MAKVKFTCFKRENSSTQLSSSQVLQELFPNSLTENNTHEQKDLKKNTWQHVVALVWYSPITNPQQFILSLQAVYQ